MLASVPNSEIIRVAVIILFAVVTLVLRATKKPTTSRPAPGAGAPRTNTFEAIREAMRQASEQASARQPQRPFQSPPSLGESSELQSFQQPPAIKPESPVLPSLLLLALAVCLCFMAYRYFAG